MTSAINKLNGLLYNTWQIGSTPGVTPPAWLTGYKPSLTERFGDWMVRVSEKDDPKGIHACWHLPEAEFNQLFEAPATDEPTLPGLDAAHEQPSMLLGDFAETDDLVGDFAVEDAVLERYEPLSEVFDLAIDQAAFGKGEERHGNGLHFLDQPMIKIGAMTGPGGPVFQAMKKAQEAIGMVDRGAFDAAQAELLGAINYLGGAHILIQWIKDAATEEHGDFKLTVIPTETLFAEFEAGVRGRHGLSQDKAA